MTEKTPPKQLPPGIEFKINEDGSVTFINVPEELMDLVYALNPDATPACELPEDATETKDQQDTNDHPHE